VPARPRSHQTRASHLAAVQNCWARGTSLAVGSDRAARAKTVQNETPLRPSQARGATLLFAWGSQCRSFLGDRAGARDGMPKIEKEHGEELGSCVGQKADLLTTMRGDDGSE
jgi:hypothetical protein